MISSKNIFTFSNRLTAVVALLVVVSGLSACNWDKSKPNVELIQDMMESPANKGQDYDEFFEDHAGGARTPPEHTQSVGFKPYRFATDMEGAKANKNPLAGDFSPETLMTGQKYYETHCMVCHGQALVSDTPVAKLMPLPPPPLNSDKIKGWTDGQIYHVVTMGQGVMGPYASHIPQKYRWQVVNYIRHLQKK